MGMQKRIVRVGEIECGADQLFLIAGPCVVEGESIMLRAAECLRELSEKLEIPVIYKSSFEKDNRSAAQNYRGPGLEEGLRILARVKEEFGFPLISDVHYPQQVKPAAEVLDVLQIPAYLCMQTHLVEEAARTGKVLNLKHGQFLAPENMMKPTQKALDAGNDQIILTERGYTFGYNDLIVDPRSFYHLSQRASRSCSISPTRSDDTESRARIRREGRRSSCRSFRGPVWRPGWTASSSRPTRSLKRPCVTPRARFPRRTWRRFSEPLIEIHNLEVKYRT